jgi:predicted lipoprotein with Yx(FWY)xxD motif
MIAMMCAMKSHMLAWFFASTTLLAVCSGAVTMAADTQPSLLKTAPLMTPSRGTQVGFVNTNGFAVYVFDRDLAMPGTSQCNDACAMHWPPISPPTTDTLPAPWGTIVRSDGTKQLTYAGRPLYSYAGDKDAKGVKGDLENARGGIWHLAQPQTDPAKSP